MNNKDIRELCKDLILIESILNKTNKYDSIELKPYIDGLLLIYSAFICIYICNFSNKIKVFLTHNEYEIKNDVTSEITEYILKVRCKSKDLILFLTMENKNKVCIGNIIKRLTSIINEVEQISSKLSLGMNDNISTLNEIRLIEDVFYCKSRVEMIGIQEDLNEITELCEFYNRFENEFLNIKYWGEYESYLIYLNDRSKSIYESISEMTYLTFLIE